MDKMKFCVLLGLLFSTTAINAGEPYIPNNPQEPQTATAPKTDAELDVAIRQVIKEIDEKIARIDRKIKEIQMIMNRIDSAITDRPKRILCEGLAFSTRDIQAVDAKLHDLTDANEHKKVEDRLNILKEVQSEQNKILKEKNVSCTDSNQ